MANKNKLQIVATPIGNISELSQRALKALNDCECILCEDTRVTSKLLLKLGLNNKKELISYQKFNEKTKLPFVLSKIKNKNTMLVSDAGYPCISDPGFNLVNACYEQNIGIEVINGPSSLMHSLVVSGLNINNFFFNGFLPASRNQRLKRLNELKDIDVPIVFFESVHRIVQSLDDIDNVFNHPYFVVCRELTKMNESIYRGQWSKIRNLIIEKGEFVVIIQKSKKEKNADVYDKKEIFLLVKKIIDKEKISLKQACKKLSQEIGLQSSLIYNIYVNHQRIN